MNLLLAYLGSSGIWSGPAGTHVALAPNLRRDRVSYAGALKHPVRFREAISALHDVVVSDLRHRPRDKTAYKVFLAERRQREAAIHAAASAEARAVVDARPTVPIPPELERRFRSLRKRYWDARQAYANYLAQHDPEAWRLLVPCDPIITVAPDALFFECFSADESSYGCLTVNRDAFQNEDAVALGTTNVDYSWALYEEFQKLRSYRRTHFAIDPKGFEVRTEEKSGYREEKIDLPSSWLRGFLQLQSAMSLPLRRVPIGCEGLYNVLAWLTRHKARRSPRALRFELTPGQPVALVLEPWERRFILHGMPSWQGTKAEKVRAWGRDRLRVLARLLPLADSVDAYLLGDGLPTFWSIRMGAMRLLLGLSGWTTNDWTGSTALDQLAPPVEPSNDALGKIAAAFQASPTRTFEQVRQASGLDPAHTAAGLNRLALMGQLVHDLDAGVYRWRQVMPAWLALDEVAPESPETAMGRKIVELGLFVVQRDETTPTGLRALAGRIDGYLAEAVLDADQRMLRGQCKCSHHHQFGLKRGPCRHLQALRRAALGDRANPVTIESWFRNLWF